MIFDISNNGHPSDTGEQKLIIMKKQKVWRIWDTVEKSYVGNSWTTRKAAEEQKEAMLREMYPDRPHTVYSVRRSFLPVS